MTRRAVRRALSSGTVLVMLVACGLLAGAAHARESAQVSGRGAQAQSSGTREPFQAQVKRVIDGDTVWLQSAGQPRARWFKVRIEGIDAPEICQPGGPASRDALDRRLSGTLVTVRLRGRDDYGRFLARLTAGGLDVGAAMVGSGQAWSYRFRWHQGAYAAQQTLAKAQRRGLFARPDAEEPRLFRKRNGPCPRP